MFLWAPLEFWVGPSGGSTWRRHWFVWLFLCLLSSCVVDAFGDSHILPWATCWIAQSHKYVPCCFIAVDVCFAPCWEGFSSSVWMEAWCCGGPAWLHAKGHLLLLGACAAKAQCRCWSVKSGPAAGLNLRTVRCKCELKMRNVKSHLWILWSGQRYFCFCIGNWLFPKSLPVKVHVVISYQREILTLSYTFGSPLCYVT